jgi:signal transduction histidine kinase
VRVEHHLDNPNAEIDQDQIVQVLTNLCNNGLAAMHGRGGGELVIRTEGDTDRVHILVSDNGTGISEEHKSKIFQPFFTTKEVGKGTGLGLAVTYGIIKMHQGDIQLESNADPAKGPTGTTFKVTLPRLRREDESSKEAESESEAAPTS